MRRARATGTTSLGRSCGAIPVAAAAADRGAVTSARAAAAAARQVAHRAAARRPGTGRRRHAREPGQALTRQRAGFVLALGAERAVAQRAVARPGRQVAPLRG